MSGNQFPWLAVLFAVSLFPSSSAFAQVSLIEEAEPNDPCVDAQVVDGVPLPISISGSLDSTDSEPDVDFFRIKGVPGQYVSITLEGAATGMGTVGDALLGYFDATCRLIAIGSDDGVSSNSRLSVQLPESGEYVLGATQCCDPEFLGGGTGSYVLNVSEVRWAERIAGRVIDAKSLEPLAGDGPPFAGATLWRVIGDGAYAEANNQATASDGTFMFTSDHNGLPLEVGTYAIQLWARAYENALTEPFEVDEGEALDLGDLLLSPLELIGSVSGRLVDDQRGWPLPGSSPPHAVVSLERWEKWNFFTIVGGIYADEQGMFLIDGISHLVNPGVFRVSVYADDYYPLKTEAFELGNKESIDLGEIAVTPVPITVSDVSGCEVLPIGDVCDFSLKIRNRGPSSYRGEAWSIVQYSPPYSLDLTNLFQVGRAGAHNPRPVRINLEEGEWTTLEFRLRTPDFVPEGTLLCVSANVGRYPYPQFDAVGDRMLFCAVTQPEGSMSQLSDKEFRRLLLELNARRE